MAFGSELVMMAGLGFVVLGPKRMHSLLGQVAHIRSEIERASRGLRNQLSEELHPTNSRTSEEETAEQVVCDASAHIPDRPEVSDLEKDAPAPEQPESQ